MSDETWKAVYETNRAAPRCEVTGNECGTDTWVAGTCCPCDPCRRYVMADRARTQGELAERKASHSDLAVTTRRFQDERDASRAEVSRMREALGAIGALTDSALCRCGRIATECDERRSYLCSGAIARRALAAPSPGKCGAYGYCDRDVVPGTTWCEKHADDRASSPGTAPPADAPRPKPFYVDHLLDDPPAASAEDALLAGSDDAADPAPVRPVGPAGRVARHLEDLPEPPCETCGGTRYVGGALSANGHEPCPRCSPHPKESP